MQMQQFQHPSSHILPPINSPFQQHMNQGAYQVQQSQFSSPPVLYSQSQPMLVSNQNNMTYQMVNLGAGAIMQKMQQRQQEEYLIDMLTKQTSLINEIADDFNFRLKQKQVEQEEELEELERQQILLRQKKAEQDYIYKLNRQLNHGLKRIREQQIKAIDFPSRPKMLGLKVPSIIKLEQLQDVYPNTNTNERKSRQKQNSRYNQQFGNIFQQ